MANPYHDVDDGPLINKLLLYYYCYSIPPKDENASLT